MLSISFLDLWSLLKTHSKFGKIILRYVAGTLGYGIWYTRPPDNTLTGYTNSDFVGSLDYRKSTSGYAFHLGTNLISWAYKKQPNILCRNKICSSHHNNLPCSLNKNTIKGYGTH